MASAYSTPQEFDNYVQPVNLDLVNFVLQSKEQKFNYNVAKVEQTLSEFGNLGLTRPEDKQYLSDRLNNMISQMGDLEKRDWSDSNVERQITAGIRGAIDGRVRQSIVLSKGLTNYTNEVNRIRQEDPDNYNEINAQMPLIDSGAQQWLAGETDTFNLSALQYIPPPDMTGTMNEIIQDHIKIHGTTEVERIPIGNNVYEVIEREVLDRDTVESIWEANVTPAMIRQMQMEADYMYRNASEEQRSSLIQEYGNKLSSQLNNYENEAQILQGKISSTTGAEKQKLQTQLENKQNQIQKVKQLQSEPTSWNKIYTKHHFDRTKEGIIDANSFNRVTSIDRDFEEANYMLSLRRQELRELEFATDQQQNQASPVSNIPVVANPIVPEDGQALNLHEQTELGIVTAVQDFTQAMINNPNFEQAYGGLTREEFNNKTTEEQQKFARERMNQVLEQGIDNAAATGVVSDEELNIINNYAANKQARDEAKKDTVATTENIAKTAYENLLNGAGEGRINLENIRTTIPELATQIENGVGYGQLNGDLKNAFRVAMIDETLRSRIDDRGIRPYLISRREQLIDEIGHQGIRNSFSRSQDLTRTGAGLRLREAGNYISSVARLVGDRITNPFGNITDRAEAVESASADIGEGIDIRRERNRRINATTIFEGNNSFEVNGQQVGFRDYIQNAYRSAGADTELKAQEIAPRLLSTSAVVLNPNVDSHEEMHQLGISRIAAQDPNISVQDMQNSELIINYNQEDDTFTFTATLDRQSANAYERLTARAQPSTPIPRSQLGELAPLIDRLEGGQRDWAMNSENQYAQGVKFKNRGFENTSQRKQAILNLASKFPTAESSQAVMRNPERFAYTRTDMTNIMSETNRITSNEEPRNFANEFPNAFQNIASGAGEFVVDYYSIHNQGYFYDISYQLGEETVDIASALPTGQRKLDTEREYLNSFKHQRDAFNLLVQGYNQSDSNIINKITEINNLNGRN